ncbi:hypothetical protein BC834DRAFT_504659 [Gloeopeniophorella convolvens]|nr:hypothetical protein BC834DRAFT_504659 [Gloeopeniophorella convolvens]
MESSDVLEKKGKIQGSRISAKGVARRRFQISTLNRPGHGDPATPTETRALFASRTHSALVVPPRPYRSPAERPFLPNKPAYRCHLCYVSNGPVSHSFLPCIQSGLGHSVALHSAIMERPRAVPTGSKARLSRTKHVSQVPNGPEPCNVRSTWTTRGGSAPALPRVTAVHSGSRLPPPALTYPRLHAA